MVFDIDAARWTVARMLRSRQQLAVTARTRHQLQQCAGNEFGTRRDAAAAAAVTSDALLRKRGPDERMECGARRGGNEGLE
jgi:hypothetical protein